MTTILLVSLLAAVQATPAFEVASIKPSAPLGGGRARGTMGGRDPGRVTYEGLPLKVLIMRAYEMKEYQIICPEWLDTERFDVVAKMPEGVPQAQVPVMLQALLTERFKLVTHKDKKEMPVYALVAGKSGIKAKEVEANDPNPRELRFSAATLTSKQKMSGLADFLSRMLGRPVLDMTGTTAIYKIALEWAPESGNGIFPAGMATGTEGTAPDSSKPSIFTAVQEQLGLKLESRKAPVDVLVVDHAEKVPTEN